MWNTWVRSLGREDPLEKEMATHSSILAWRIPWTEEFGGLQSTGRKESGTTKQLHFHHYIFLVAQRVQNLPAMCKTWARSLGKEDTLEKGKTTHSSILA